MSDTVIRIEKMGKMYRLYKRPMDKILDAFGLNFWRKNYYQEFWALRDIELEVNRGERLGIIGHNGAGKSTLLKIITGNVSHTEGNVVVNGRIQALMELGTGFHPEFTGRENIQVSLAYQGFSARQIEEKEEEIIDFAELDEFIDQPIKTYSAGMYARLAFSTATTIEPEILIIDEVLGAGDAYFAGKCIERMRSLTDDSGATVLFVSHDLSSVMQLCDRIVWIDKGRVKDSGNPLKIIKEYSVMVRKAEEIRLRARDLKVSKKQAVLLDRMEDIYQPLLFHFICKNGSPPAGKNRIYMLRILSGEEEIGAIEVGGPMDNSPDQLHYLMDNQGYMDWGSPCKDNHGPYREYANFKGRYRHAPFEFSIPKTFLSKPQSFILEINARVEEDVFIEVFNGNNYRFVGVLNPCEFSTFKIELPGDVFDFEETAGILLESDNINEAQEAQEDQLPVKDLLNDIDKNIIENTFDITDYGSKEAKITSVRMLDYRGQDTRVFEVGKPLKVVFDYEANFELVRPVFVFCIYMTDGRCASQWVADESMYGIIKAPVKGTFIFSLKKLTLGRGSYVASAAIFKKLSVSGLEAESYHVLDRCIHFEVLQAIGDNIERGLCLQPFEVKLLDGRR